MNTLKNKTILITGGHGFLGRHLTPLFKGNLVISPRSNEYNLREQKDCRDLFKLYQFDIVIHLAASVGGIGYNQDNPASLFYDNAMMGINVMHEAYKAGVKKFVQVGTICAYPKITPVPFKEDNLWNGYPEETNAPYGLAKKMLLVQSQAYRKQYDFNAIYVLPVNLYGPHDNFDLNSSHVIPAMIRKFTEAKKEGKPFVEIWGSGNPTREFLYVEDAARAIYLATKNYDSEEPVNIGSGMEISIRNLALLIKKLTKYEGEITFNSNKPDGQPRRMLDTTKAKEFGFTASTSFGEGLKKTITWYESVS